MIGDFQSFLDMFSPSCLWTFGEIASLVLQFVSKLGSNILSRSPCWRKNPGQLVFNRTSPTGRVADNMSKFPYFRLFLSILFLGSWFVTNLNLVLPAMHSGGCAALPFLGPRPFLVVCTILLPYILVVCNIHVSCGLVLYIFGFSPSLGHKTIPGLGSNKMSRITLNLKCSHWFAANAENTSNWSLITHFGKHGTNSDKIFFAIPNKIIQ